MAQTPIWPLEVPALDSTSEMTANSLAGQVVAIKGVTDTMGDVAADVSDIKDVTDALPDAGALTALIAETDKIDGAATDGLLGTHNSLA